MSSAPVESFGGDDHWTQAEVRRPSALLELGLGNDDAARLALDRVHELLHPVGHPGFIRYVADRIEVLVRLGDQDEAQKAIADLKRAQPASATAVGQPRDSREPRC